MIRSARRWRLGGPAGGDPDNPGPAALVDCPVDRAEKDRLADL